MKKIAVSMVTAIVMAMSIVMAPAASAHWWVTWYWSEAKAEFMYETRYDVNLVECRGYGRKTRKDFQWLYKHFDCYVLHWDGSTEVDTLHVKYRRAFVVYD